MTKKSMKEEIMKAMKELHYTPDVMEVRRLVYPPKHGPSQGV